MNTKDINLTPTKRVRWPEFYYYRIVVSMIRCIFQNCKVALSPFRRFLLNFAKSFIVSCFSEFDNENGGHWARFSYMSSALKLMVFLARHILTTVTCCTKKWPQLVYQWLGICMIKLVAVRNELETDANLLLGSRLLTNRAGIRGSARSGATILDRIKRNNEPLPPKAMMKARRSKNAPFWSHWNGGRGGPDFPFILSKIVPYNFRQK